ncbi:MAG: polysaccharide biosynthesis C-terminal domain-containing protein [Fibrobacteres bacterium]|jgi:O-antigen/teichoic acid export membrane protein|nr:polysaccharide biosynthesis C-terminal domain-containing protein [Fibrobacterota bacterium]
MPPSQDPPPAAGPAASAQGHREFINRGSRFMLLDNVSKAAEPLLVLLCARAYAGGEWGMFKYYESLILLLTRLGSLGLDRGVVWIYARCENDGVFVRRFSRCVNLVFLLSGLLFFGALAQYAGYLPTFGSWTASMPHSPALTFALFMASVPVQACALLFLQSLLNKRVLVFGLMIRNLIVPVLIYGPALALSYTPLKSVGLALPYLGGNLAGLALAMVGFLRNYQVNWKDWAFSAFPSRSLLRFSLPLASTDFFMSFAYRFDILLLGRYSGIREVEIYSVIVMISNTLRSLRQSFDGIMLSVFSTGAEGVDAGRRRNFNYATWMVTTVQVPFVFLALIFGREILWLISPVYAPGMWVLAIATFFNLGATLGSFSAQLLIGLGRTFMIPVSQVAFILSSLALNYLIIPHYGAEGAAFATGVATLLGGLVAFGGVWAYARSPVLQWEYLSPLLTGSLFYLAATALHFLAKPGLPADIAAFAAASAAFGWHARGKWKKFNAPRP